MDVHDSMNSHDSLHTNDGIVAVFLCGFVILHAVMKSVTTAVAATAPATAPAPEAKPKPAMKGTMVRTIKVDFDQSEALSELVSRHIVQQRWAYNRAVKKTLDDPTVTRLDLNNMLTKWRDNNKWLKGGIDIQRAGLA